MRVFVSHERENGRWAAAIADALEKAGHKPWMAEREILPGQNWAEEVATALNEADAMVVVLSKGWAESWTLRHELEFALGTERFEGRLILVTVGDPSKIGLPAAARYLNLVHATQDEVDAARDVVSALSPTRKAG